MYFKMVAESRDEIANIRSMQYYVKGYAILCES